MDTLPVDVLLLILENMTAQALQSSRGAAPDALDVPDPNDHPAYPSRAFLQVTWFANDYKPFVPPPRSPDLLNAGTLALATGNASTCKSVLRCFLDKQHSQQQHEQHSTRDADLMAVAWAIQNRFDLRRCHSDGGDPKPKNDVAAHALHQLHAIMDRVRTMAPKRRQYAEYNLSEKDEYLCRVYLRNVTALLRATYAAILTNDMYTLSRVILPRVGDCTFRDVKPYTIRQFATYLSMEANNLAALDATLSVPTAKKLQKRDAVANALELVPAVLSAEAQDEERCHASYLSNVVGPRVKVVMRHARPFLTRDREMFRRFAVEFVSGHNMSMTNELLRLLPYTSYAYSTVRYIAENALIIATSSSVPCSPEQVDASLSMPMPGRSLLTRRVAVEDTKNRAILDDLKKNGTLTACVRNAKEAWGLHRSVEFLEDLEILCDHLVHLGADSYDSDE